MKYQLDNESREVLFLMRARNHYRDTAADLLEVLTDARNALLNGNFDDLEGILTGDVCIRAIEKATT